MPAIEYKVVAGEKPVGQLSPEEVTLLAFRMNAPILYRCCQMAMHGSCTWTEAMQTAAIEQAKVIERQQAELVRLMSMSSVPAMFSNALAQADAACGVSPGAEGSAAR
jgi:hypothetical protein